MATKLSAADVKSWYDALNNLPASVGLADKTNTATAGNKATANNINDLINFVVAARSNTFLKGKKTSTTISTVTVGAKPTQTLFDAISA